MPQKVLHTKVAVADPKLGSDFLAAIGAAAVEWAHLELALGMAVSKFAGTGLETAILALANMTARSKLDTTGALSGFKLDGVPFDEFQTMLATARTLSTKRNLLVHAHWIGLDAQGRALSIEISSRHRGPEVRYAAWTLGEVTEIGEACRKLFHEIGAFLIKQGLWNGKLFE